MPSINVINNDTLCTHKIKQGEKIYNFTIGDFDPDIFPIPVEFENEIIQAYQNHYTNYPASDGILELRQAVADFIAARLGLVYATNEINFILLVQDSLHILNRRMQIWIIIIEVSQKFSIFFYWG